MNTATCCRIQWLNTATCCGIQWLNTDTFWCWSLQMEISMLTNCNLPYSYPSRQLCKCSSCYCPLLSDSLLIGELLCHFHVVHKPITGCNLFIMSTSLDANCSFHLGMDFIILSAHIQFFQIGYVAPVQIHNCLWPLSRFFLILCLEIDCQP